MLPCLDNPVAPSRPRHASRLIEADVRGRRVLYDPVRRRVIELRADADAIWPLFDGSNELQALAVEMAEVSGLDEGTAHTHLIAIVAELEAAGLLEPHDPGGS